jgi:hypothetical protein
MKIESSDILDNDCVAVLVQVSRVDDEYFSTLSLQLPEDKDEINLTEIASAISGLEYAHDQLCELLESLENEAEEEIANMEDELDE